tara:strand:+ start:961 stop:1809 length:849 start_codon:yes stop_codon:yes gene_type:complete
MAWLRLEASFGRHPKTRRLARRLGLDLLQVRGLLVGLWVWALEFAPDGDLRSFDAEAIAEGCGWLDVAPEGDPGALVAELESVGLLDRTGDGWVVHDWMEYAGSLKAAQAQREKRRRKAERGQSSDRTGTVPVLYRDRTRTVPKDGRTDETDGMDGTDGTDGGQLALTPPPPPSSPVVLEVPCSGRGRGGVFEVTEDDVRQWSEDFPGVDVEAVCRRAAVWSRENAKRRKTHGRMRAWLTGVWLAKAQDEARPGVGSARAGYNPPEERTSRIMARAEAWAKE